MATKFRVGQKVQYPATMDGSVPDGIGTITQVLADDPNKPVTYKIQMADGRDITAPFPEADLKTVDAPEGAAKVPAPGVNPASTGPHGARDPHGTHDVGPGPSPTSHTPSTTPAPAGPSENPSEDPPKSPPSRDPRGKR